MKNLARERMETLRIWMQTATPGKTVIISGRGVAPLFNVPEPEEPEGEVVLEAEEAVNRNAQAGAEASGDASAQAEGGQQADADAQPATEGEPAPIAPEEAYAQVTACTLEGFQEHPAADFRLLAASVFSPWAEPGVVQKRCAELEELGRVGTVVALGDDSFYCEAGATRALSLGASLREGVCCSCGRVFDVRQMSAFAQAAAEEDAQPRCVCGGIVRPAFAFADERVPDVALESAKQAVRDADVVLIAGASLADPVVDVLFAEAAGKKVIVASPNASIADKPASLRIKAPLESVFRTI